MLIYESNWHLLQIVDAVAEDPRQIADGEDHFQSRIDENETEFTNRHAYAPHLAIFTVLQTGVHVHRMLCYHYTSIPSEENSYETSITTLSSTTHAIEKLSKNHLRRFQHTPRNHYEIDLSRKLTLNLDRLTGEMRDIGNENYQKFEIFKISDSVCEFRNSLASE